MSISEANVGVCHDRMLPLDLEEDGRRAAVQESEAQDADPSRDPNLEPADPMMAGQPDDEHDEAETSSARDTGSTFRALLIGIDFYFPNRLESGATYASLSGCVNDVGLVESALRAHVTGPLELTKLVAYDDGAGQPGGPSSEWPTYANMKAAFEALITRAQPGDQVYIHYSGHGGRIPTMFGDLKGSGRYDETLVPMDIGKASPYLNDVDLVYYLDALTRKSQAIVTVVLDSCHSGGATRGIDVAPRCATGAREGVDPTLDTTERPAGGVAPPEELRAAWKRLVVTGAAPGGAVGTTWLPESNDYVLLAACRDDQSALEASVDGAQRGGVMTAAFLNALTRLGKDQTWKTLYERLFTLVHSQHPTQTPQFLGKGERQVLGVTLRPVEYKVRVIGIDETSRRVRLSAGRATGMKMGSKFGFYVPGTMDFTQGDKRVGGATVDEVTGTESWAKLDEGTPVDKVEPGAPAILEDVGSVALKRSVNLFRRNDLPPGIDQERAFAALRAAIETRGRGFLVLHTSGTPHYQVAIDDGGQYEIWDPSGKPMPNVPAVSVAAPKAAELVVDRLIHIFRYKTIEEIYDPFSGLKDALRVELRAPPPGWSPGDWIEGGTVIEPKGGRYVVKPGSYSFVRVVNESDRRVNIVAIDLEDDWSIGPVMPPDPSREYYTTVEAHQHAWFALGAVLRAGRASAKNIIKILVTVDDSDFWWLLHPPIDRPITRSERRRASAARDTLFRLREALDADKNEESRMRVVSQPGFDWTVQQIIVDTE
ncbi:caspase family protein [Sorangium sp. So ce1153]|uniref:caspase family protein n=1 Tax=Sorangium sp. So ce1153 TaxID=3133333 RepID=UPI003F616C83